MSHSVSEFDIAIIGCAGRFPGAENTEQLWEQLLKGESGIRELRSDERTGNTSYTDRVWQGGVLDNPHHFDPGFFGISDQDAELMDPQLRIAIEQIWQTLEQEIGRAHV